MRDLVLRRLRQQRLTAVSLKRPEDVVAWMGAVQAQEFEPALWALGLRLPATATASAVLAAFNAGRLLRTHVMRPTWHFVHPADIRWMQSLTSPRVQRIAAPYNRKLGLDAKTLTKAMRVMAKALGRERYLTRTQLGDHLAAAGLAFRGQHLAHVMMHAELECLICSGPRVGKQFTYALVDERAPHAAALPRDEALATLVERFFRSHGPATVKDFAWWSGLTSADGRRGLEMIRAARMSINGLDYWTVGSPPRAAAAPPQAHLLPIYDEYVVAYRDRGLVPHGPSVVRSQNEAIIFQHAIIVDGQITGTWRSGAAPRTGGTTRHYLRRLTRDEGRAVERAAVRHARFMAG